MLCIEIKRFFIDIIKFNIVIVLNDDILNKNLGIFCQWGIVGGYWFCLA